MKKRVVSAMDTEADITRVMAVPTRLVADDVREFALIEWAPRPINWGHGSVVAIDAVIQPSMEMPDGD